MKGFSLKSLFVGKAENGFTELFRALVVGGIAFIADFGVMVLLKELGGLPAVASATLSFVVGVTVNYLLSNFWVFNKSTVDSAAKRVVMFVLLSIVGLLINDGIIWLFEHPFADKQLFGALISPDYYYMIGKIVATVVVFFWNFLSRKFLLYNNKKTGAEGEK